jgi:hypothetical protein
VPEGSSGYGSLHLTLDSPGIRRREFPICHLIPYLGIRELDDANVSQTHKNTNPEKKDGQHLFDRYFHRRRAVRGI